MRLTRFIPSMTDAEMESPFFISASEIVRVAGWDRAVIYIRGEDQPISVCESAADVWGMREEELCEMAYVARMPNAKIQPAPPPAPTPVRAPVPSADEVRVGSLMRALAEVIQRKTWSCEDITAVLASQLGCQMHAPTISRELRTLANFAGSL